MTYEENVQAYLQSTAGQTTTPVPLDLARFRDPEPVTALAAAPGTAPGGGAQEAATPGRAACDAFWAAIGAGPSGEQPPDAAWNWAHEANAHHAWEAAAAAAWAPERDRLSAALAERDDYAARLKATDQSWAVVAAERDAWREDCIAEREQGARYRKALGHALHVLEEHDEPGDDARSRALAIISAELEATP